MYYVISLGIYHVYISGTFMIFSGVGPLWSNLGYGVELFCYATLRGLQHIVNRMCTITLGSSSSVFRLNILCVFLETLRVVNLDVEIMYLIYIGIICPIMWSIFNCITFIYSRNCALCRGKPHHFYNEVSLGISNPKF